MGDREVSPFNGDVYPRIWLASGPPAEQQPSMSETPPDLQVDNSSVTVTSRPQIGETNNAADRDGKANDADVIEKPDRGKYTETHDEALPDNGETQTVVYTEEDGEEEQRLVIDVDERSLDMDSELDAKRRKRKSFRPKKYEPVGHDASTASLGGTHGEGAQLSDLGHVWKPPSEKQREYNREYKRKRRSDPDVRARERERQKEYQRLRRSDPSFVATERQKRKARERGKTTDSAHIQRRRARQREYARSRRADPQYAAREREKNKLYQRQRRENPTYVSQEREKQRKRLESLRGKRTDPEVVAKEREKNREYQRQKRTDPTHIAKEKEKRKERLERLKADPEQWAEYQAAQKERARSKKTDQSVQLQSSEDEDSMESAPRSEIVHPSLYGQEKMLEGEVSITYETANTVMQSQTRTDDIVPSPDNLQVCEDRLQDHDPISQKVYGDDLSDKSVEIQGKVDGGLGNVRNNRMAPNVLTIADRHKISGASGKQVEEIILKDPALMDQNSSEPVVEIQAKE